VPNSTQLCNGAYRRQVGIESIALLTDFVSRRV
jgi:hypothetical protein